jgi:putative membrane protein
MANRKSSGFFFRMITTTLAIMVTAYLLPGVHVKDVIAAILLSIVLAFLNMIIKPILILLTLPITIVTFGLFLFVVNALIIQLASGIVPGFSVDGFWWALLFSIVLSLTVSLLDGLQNGFGRK